MTYGQKDGLGVESTDCSAEDTLGSQPPNQAELIFTGTWTYVYIHTYIVCQAKRHADLKPSIWTYHAGNIYRHEHLGKTIINLTKRP